MSSPGGDGTSRYERTTLSHDENLRVRVFRRFNYIPCDDDVRNSRYFSRYYYALGLEGIVRKVPKGDTLFNTRLGLPSCRVTRFIVLVTSRRAHEA